MSIYKSSVNNPITTIMIFVGVIVLGIFSLTRIPIDLFPEMDPPYISVITTYPGANASDIETNITRPLEDAFNSVDNLKKITSVSSDNISVVSLEFNWESDLNEASSDIRELIDLVMSSLPDGVERPTLFKFNMSMMPILYYAITAEESYNGLDKILEEKLVNPLNRIDGVGSVNISGAPERRVYVEADPERLNAYNLTLEQLSSAVQAENLNMPAGKVKMGAMDYQLRVQGEIKESRELEELVVGYYNGAAVHLKEVATVRDTIKDMTLDETINGDPGVRLFIMKQSGANTVKIAQEVRDAIELHSRELPPDVKITELADTSEFITKSVDNLTQTIFWALFFVVLVVLYFLGKWRATVIVALTIPVSLIVSFIYIFITGGSLNIISLASISIALGMVVDDAIVVLENISRHIERGTSPREAAIYATNEVWVSVIVTTLVVVAVFFPLTMVGGMTGVIFKQLGWIVTITVVVSTIAAITLTPMLSSLMLGNGKKKNKESIPGRFSYERIVEPVLSGIENIYEKSLEVALANKKKVLILSMSIFAASLMLTRFIGMDFIPETDQAQLSAEIELTNGLRVEETASIARSIESVIKEGYPEVEMISASSGADEDGGLMSLFSSTGSNMINLTMRLSSSSQRERSIWEIAEGIRTDLTRFPEIAEYSVSTSSSGAVGSSTVDVEIFGYDFDTTTTLAHQLRHKISEIRGATDVQVSRKDEKAELQLALDKQKMAASGLNTAMVSSALRNGVSGITTSYLREEGEEYDIVVRYPESARNTITGLESIIVTNGRGDKIRIGEIGTIREYFSPPNIERSNRERVVTVSASPSQISIGELAAQIEGIVATTPLPQGVMVNIAGSYQDMSESFTDLGLLLMISVILVFIVMASQFESFSIPFIIMFSIPFSFTGVILILLLTGTSLSIIAGIGAILLIGIVVKNGIVLVDYINLMRDRGYALNIAIVQACKMRIRPVLMTALTTILAMVPMALSAGEGAEIWKPMGITLIGGLIFSTLVTLILIPVLYGLVSRRGERDKIRKVRSRFTFLEKSIEE